MKWDKKPVLQFRKDGTLVRRLESTCEAKLFGDDKGMFSDTSVARCARGERKSYRGYIWIYESDFTAELLNDKVKAYNKRWDDKRKPVVQLELDGTFVKRYDSITQARDELFLSCEMSIINVIKKKKMHNTCIGHLWMYEEDYLRREQQ